MVAGRQYAYDAGSCSSTGPLAGLGSHVQRSYLVDILAERLLDELLGAGSKRCERGAVEARSAYQEEGNLRERAGGGSEAAYEMFLPKAPSFWKLSMMT